MKYFLVAVGTRGDVEPFLAMGKILQRQGEEVACCFSEQFRPLVEQEGFQFFSLGPEFLNMLDSDAGKAVMGGAKVGFIKRLQYFYTLYKQSMPVTKNYVRMQHEFIEAWQPDKIIFHPKAVYPFTLKTKNKFILSPIPGIIHAVKGMPPAGVNFYLGERLNRFIYKMLYSAIVKSVTQVAAPFLKQFNTSRKEVRANVVETPIMYMVSPTLIPRPHDWPEYVQILGYQERDKIIHWQAPEGLETFLEHHKKPIILTFGSMVNGNATETTAMFLRIFEELNIPAIINKSAGGLEEPPSYNKNLFYFTSDIPYDWVFRKVYGVIHHGGSGTTHMTIKNGCASLIIPHIVDQFMWNNILSKKGMGPKGISIRKLKQEKLEALIQDFYTNDSYKSNAVSASAKMSAEDFEDKIHAFLNFSK